MIQWQHFCHESLTWVDRCFSRLVFISIALMRQHLHHSFQQLFMERLSRVMPQSNLNRSDTQICTNMQSKQAFALLSSLIRRQLSFFSNKMNGLLMLWLENSYAKSSYTCQHFKTTAKIFIQRLILYSSLGGHEIMIAYMDAVSVSRSNWSH